MNLNKRQAFKAAVLASLALCLGAAHAAGLAGFTQASYYTNGRDSRTDGVDIIGRRQWKLQGGQLELSAAASLLNTKVEDVHRTVTIGGAQLLAIGGAKVRDAETGTPKNKIVLGARWSGGKWTIVADATRYGRYRYNVGDVADSVAANGNRDQVFAPETYLDASVGYKLSERWKFDLNVQNLFNRYPDKYILQNRASGINPYSFIAPDGASGVSSRPGSRTSCKYASVRQTDAPLVRLIVMDVHLYLCIVRGQNGSTSVRPPAAMMPFFARHLVLGALFAACALPALAGCPKPTYPREALRHRAQGMTIVAYRLQANGSVERTVLLSSSGYPDLDRVAQETLARCDFSQAVADGQPAGTWYPAVYPWVRADDPDMRQLKQKLLSAASSGDAVARYQLSLLMAHGARSDYEQRQAVDLLRGAAELGVAHAQFDLGHRYETGSGVEADGAEAIRWYEKSAAQGDVLALQRLRKDGRPTANQDLSD